jgi:hypothetical protein
MKKVSIYFLFIIAFALKANAQTGIGTTSPDASAKLDVSSTNKGFLPPRVTLTSGTDNTTIPNPATGLLVYNTGNNSGLVAGYYYWNGSGWATIATASGSGVSTSILRGSRTSGQTSGLTNGGTIVFTKIDNMAGQEITLNTSTGQITLAAGRTYRLMAQVPNFQTTSPETRLQLAWYNETVGEYIGSSSSSYPPNSGAAYGATGGMSEAVITTTTSTIVSYRIVQISNASQIGGNGDFSNTGSYPWFDIQLISGNAPFNQFNFGDVKTGFQTSDHNGWIKLDGRLKSSLSSSQQSQATSLGFITNLPDASNAFLVQNGGTPGSVIGSNTKTITQANLPNVSLTGNTSTDAGHTHTTPFTTSTMNLSWGVSYGGGAGYNVSGASITGTSGAHAHTLTTSSLNSGVTQTALDVTPKSLTVNTFIYLGN